MNKEGFIRYLNCKYENKYKHFIRTSSFKDDLIYVEIKYFSSDIIKMICKNKEKMLTYFLEWIIIDNDFFIKEEIEKYKYKFMYNLYLL